MLSDRIVVQITQKPGESFIDRMIALVEGANRQKTPNEIALNILLAALTIIFLLAVATLQPLAIFSKAQQPGRARTPRPSTGNGVTGIVLVSLLVCLIPTTIGALLSAIGIAGMDRLVQRNVLAMSGRAVEAAGDVNTLLLDKTGTITLGNRQASEFVPVDGVAAGDAGRRRAAVQPRRRDPRGPLDRGLRQDRSTGCASGTPGELSHATWVPFTAQTRMSGVDLAEDGGGPSGPQGRRDRGDEVGPRQRRAPDRRRSARSSTASRASGGTPLVVAELRRRPAGPRARRHPPQGRRQGRACGSGSTRCAGWASAP